MRLPQLLSVLLLLTSQQCAQPDYTKLLTKKWFHSYEEDAPPVEVYRPSTYSFPPPRGRRGIEFKADGTFIRYDIAPTDGELPVPGTWKPVKNQRAVTVEVPGNPPATYQLEIVAADENTLKVKRL